VESSHVFGLTGGIATGKSAVAQCFGACGITVVDADVLAREIMLPGAAAFRDVHGRFGDSILDSTGAIDRAKLGAMVFADEALRIWLNSVTHPRITLALAGHVQAARTVLVAYDAALLVETGAYQYFRPLVVVTCEPEVQLARLMARNHLTEAAARARIASQLPLSEKAAVADYLIENNASLEALAQRVGEVARLLHAKLIDAKLPASTPQKPP
jgi:dephospho-CoA kinase